jgi:L-lactate dehydrogenase complex protein LldF
VTVYSSHVHGPRDPRGGGAQALHVILVDNGRTAQLGRDGFWRSLKCIRCGACMNTCPIYRRSGGHSYGSTVPGPIGSVLTPGLDLQRYASLPFASTLCGSCADVCPVRIDLHHQLLALRQDLARQHLVPWQKRFVLRTAALVLAWSGAYRLAGWLARQLVPRLPRWLVYVRWNVWGRGRELPVLPRHSFRALYRRRHGKS